MPESRRTHGERDGLVELELATAEATQAAAERLASVLAAGDVVLLTGELGAGKTTFTQGLGRGLGVREGIISPTFVLARVHPSLGEGPQLVHVDAYRLGSAAELEDLDLVDSVERSVTVVEWGRERAEGLSESRLEVQLLRPVGGAVAEGEVPPWEDEALEDAEAPRILRLETVGPRWDARARRALAAALLGA